MSGQDGDYYLDGKLRHARCTEASEGGHSLPWMLLPCATAPLQVACVSLAREGEGKVSSERFGTPPDEVKPTSRLNSSMRRRDFLKLSGTGLAGAVLLGSTSDQVLAQTRSSLKSEFQTAAAKYKVPKELLMAMGYVNTLWEMPRRRLATTCPEISTAAVPTASCSSCKTLGMMPWAGRPI